MIDSRRPAPPALLPPALGLPAGGIRFRGPPARPGLLPISAAPSGAAFRTLPGFLRPPPVPGRRAALDTVTLRRINPPTDWAELVLAGPDSWFSPVVRDRAVGLLAHLREARAGGTWWGRRAEAPGHALVFAGADTVATRRALLAAIETHGAGRTALVAPHGAGWAAACRRNGVRLIAGPVDPWPLIEGAAAVYAAGRSEALLLATVLGVPARPWSPGPLSLGTDPARLVAATLLAATRYADPFTGEAATAEDWVALIADWRRTHGGVPVACCLGISFWKRRRMAEMLGGGAVPAFRKTAEAAVRAAARRGGAVAAWPSRAPAGLAAHTEAAGVPLARVEDGFIRSVGLGADFLPPLSVVLDRLGIYYDATRPSELERILLSHPFPPALLARAAALRARVVREGVTKYNLRGALPPLPAGRRVVLVPGQVADDRSVLLGGGGLGPGLPLLARVREAEPDAFIIYKPHPDVLAGYRPGALEDAAVLRHADLVLRGGSMDALLSRVDAVHTLTSLTGFEALLRGVAVFTWGQPFYAGWGLTTDSNAPPGRGRDLTLEALVAGTLILYPRYFDPVSRLPCGPEIVLNRLAEPDWQRVNALITARRLQGRLLNFLRGVLRRAPTKKRVPVR